MSWYRTYIFQDIFFSFQEYLACSQGVVNRYHKIRKTAMPSLYSIIRLPSPNRIIWQTVHHKHHLHLYLKSAWIFDNNDNDQDVRGADCSVHKGFLGQNGNSTRTGALPWLSGDEDDHYDRTYIQLFDCWVAPQHFFQTYIDQIFASNM